MQGLSNDQQLPIVAGAHFSLGSIALRQDKIPDCLEHLEKALEAKKKIGDPATDEIHGLIATAYDKLNMIPQAIEEAQKALEIKTSLVGEINNKVADFHSQLAGLYRTKKEYELSMAHSLDAIRIRRTVDPKAMSEPLFRDYFNAMNSCLSLNLYENCIEHGYRALEIANNLGRSSFLATPCIISIASAHSQTGNHGKSVELIENHFSSGCVITTEQRKILTLTLGNCHIKLGNKMKAKENIDKVFALLNTSHDLTDFVIREKAQELLARADKLDG